MRQIKCNKCGFIGDDSKFKKGRDFFQNPFVSACPKCNNKQSPGDASMRMFGGERPFEFIQEKKSQDPLSEVLNNANEAS